MSVPAGAPPGARAAGDQHARRPCLAAGPAASAWRAGRGPRRGPAVHPRRGGGVPERGRRARPGRRRRRGAGGAHRGVDRRRCSWRRSRSRGATTSAGFIAGFAGDDRYVVDYLVEEVLARQPDAVRRFLLETSILDRLSGSLCDAVTGGDDGKSVLELLDRSNLFVVAARRQPPVVPLPPSLRRRPARASARGAARGARRPAPPRRPVVRRGRARRFLRFGTRSRPVTSSGRPSWSSWRSRAAAGAAGGHDPALARRHPARGGARPAGAGRGLHRGADGEPRVRGPREPARRPRAVAGHGPVVRGDGRARRGRARPGAGCDRDLSSCPGAGARRPVGDRRARRPGDRPRRRRRPPQQVGRVGPLRPRHLGERRPGGRAPALLGRRRGATPGRALLGRARLLDHARRPPDHPGTSRRCPTYLRGRAGARGSRAGHRDAGYAGHARGTQPDRLRTRRPRCGLRTPGPSRGAGRAPGSAAVPVPPPGRPRPAAPGRRRPGRRRRAARGGRARLRRRLLTRRAARSRRCEHACW